MTWRNTIRQNTFTELSDYKTANPSILKEVHRSQPPNVRGTPSAWVGDIRTEFTAVGSDLRVTTDTEVDIMIVTNLSDDETPKDETDDLLDGLTDHFSATAQKHYLGSNTVAEPVRASDTSLTIGGVVYTGAILTIGRITGQEGL